MQQTEAKLVMSGGWHEKEPHEAHDAVNQASLYVYYRRETREDCPAAECSLADCIGDPNA